jgi:sporulation protein YlmC with PRC-barrel domain
MHNTKRQGLVFLALASCAAASLGTARATPPAPGTGIVTEGAAASQDANGNAASAMRVARLPHLASRDMAEHYYQAYRLIGSHVLNLDGKRIGQVSGVILDDHGDVRKVMIALTDASDAEGGAIAISPHRAEVVSTNGALVTVIRVDLSREEIVQAQLVRLKSDARAPAQRGAGLPDLHREYGPLY